MGRSCRSNVSKSNRGGVSNGFCSGYGDGGDKVLVIGVAMVVASTVAVRVTSCEYS